MESKGMPPPPGPGGPPPSSNANDTDKIIMILLVLFIPPCAIWYYDKQCTGQVCLNILLLCLGGIPAVIHALWYCFMRN